MKACSHWDAPPTGGSTSAKPRTRLAAAVRHLQPDVAIVFITSTAQVESLERAATASGASVLHKPVKMQTLVQVVRRLSDASETVFGTESRGSDRVEDS